MKSAVSVVAAIAVVALLFVGGVSAYSSMYSDDIASQDIHEIYAILKPTTALTQDITVSEGIIKFGATETLTITYDDTEDSDCYINVVLSGIGVGNTVKISIVQEYSTTSKTFTGSAVADASGNVAINGFGLIKDGNITVFGTVSGSADNAPAIRMTLVAYPQTVV